MYLIGIWGSILSSTWGTGPSLSLKSREGYIEKNEKSIKHKFLLSPPSAEPAPDLEVSGAVDVVAEAAGVAPQDGGGGEEEEEEEGEQHGVPERSYTCDSRLANGVLRGPLRPLFNPHPTPRNRQEKGDFFKLFQDTCQEVEFSSIVFCQSGARTFETDMRSHKSTLSYQSEDKILFPPYGGGRRGNR